jgi:hypothetical protein
MLLHLYRHAITFIAKITSGEAKAADDAESVEWLPVNDERDLAFDHNKIMKDYRQWRKTKATIGH